jgi:hypothetical protein
MKGKGFAENFINKRGMAERRVLSAMPLAGFL